MISSRITFLKRKRKSLPPSKDLGKWSPYPLRKPANQQRDRDYQVTPSGVCPRTINAACVKYMPSKDFRNYVQGRATKAFDTRKTWKIIREWIETYLRESNTTIEALESLTAQSEGQVGHQKKVASLRRRWEQIRVMCQNALDKINATQLEA
jgi:hypothetical protein